MVLQCASRPLSRAILGVRAMSAMSAGQTPDSDRKNKTTKPPAAEDSKGVNTEELSGRAKFKAVPIDAAVMKRIYDMRLTSPMGAAMRNAIRADPEGVAAEKLYKGFSRGPLYRDIPGRDAHKSHSVSFLPRQFSRKLTFRTLRACHGNDWLNTQGQANLHRRRPLSRLHAAAPAA
jgi:hypothetical protein